MYLRFRLYVWRQKIKRAIWALSPFWARRVDPWEYGPAPFSPGSPAWQFLGRILGRRRRAKLASKSSRTLAATARRHAAEECWSTIQNTLNEMRDGRQSVSVLWRKCLERLVLEGFQVASLFVPTPVCVWSLSAI